ncbi:MAG: hypothetical protein ABL956_15980 [Hyphomonadaceae bacterium]
MSREQEVMQMRKQVGVPAEQAGRLLDVTGRQGKTARMPVRRKTSWRFSRA